MSKPIYSGPDYWLLSVIAKDMGLELDSMGLPLVQGYGIDAATGDKFLTSLDWNPLYSDTQCLELLLRYDLSLMHRAGGVSVYCGASQAPVYSHAKGAPDALECLRRAVVECVAHMLQVREILQAAGEAE